MIPTPVLEHRVMVLLHATNPDGPHAPESLQRGRWAEFLRDELRQNLDDSTASGWRYAYTIPAGAVTFVVFTRERSDA